MTEALHILFADDDPDDRLLVLDALQQCGTDSVLSTVGDGEELLEFLRLEGRYAPPALAPRPMIVLLDMNMPRMDGREVLAVMKADEQLRRIPVVVLTTSRAAEDVYRSYDLGANAYFGKPVSFDELVDVLRTISEHWLRRGMVAPG